MKAVKKFMSDEGGQTLPFFAITLTFLVTLAALSMNIGSLTTLKSKAYNIAEASGLSIKDQLKQGVDEAALKESAINYAVLNGAKREDVHLEARYNVPIDGGNKINKALIVISTPYKMSFGNFLGRGDGADVETIEGRYEVIAIAE